MSTKNRAIAYLRVSTDKQATEGVSLDAQKAKVMSYASLYGIEIVEVVTDAGLSASNLKREGMAKARAMIASGEADGILAVKLDRLTRSVMDLGVLLAEFEKHGANIWLVDEQIDTRTANGRMVLNVLMSVSQWEREIIKERTCNAMAFKRSKGDRLGAVPRGSRVDAEGNLVEDEREQLVIARARDLRASGATLKVVTSTLAEEGHVTRRGKPYALSSVASMLAA